MNDDTPVEHALWCPKPDYDGQDKEWGRDEWLARYREAAVPVVRDDNGLHVVLGVESGMTAVAFPDSALNHQSKQTEIFAAWLVVSTTAGLIGFYKHPGKGQVLTEDAVRKMPVTLTVEEQYYRDERSRFEQHHLRTRLLRDGTRVQLPDGEASVEWWWGQYRSPGDTLGDLPPRYEDAFTEPDVPLAPTSLADIAEPTLLPGGFARSGELTLLVGTDQSSVETVLAALAAKLGSRVGWLDYGAAGPARIAGLLRALHVDVEKVAYQHRPPVVTRLALEPGQFDLIVVDAMAGLADLAHMDERHRRGLTTLLDRMTCWAQAGPAVVVVDRPRSFQGGHRPFGSQAKIEAAGAVWFVEVIERLGVGREGLARLLLVEDKRGDLASEVSVSIDLSSAEPEVAWQ